MNGIHQSPVPFDQSKATMPYLAPHSPTAVAVYTPYEQPQS